MGAYNISRRPVEEWQRYRLERFGYSRKVSYFSAETVAAAICHAKKLCLNTTGYCCLRPVCYDGENHFPIWRRWPGRGEEISL